MSAKEITGAIINSDYATNDPHKIDLAVIAKQQVEYVSREYAKVLARSTKRAEWNTLANAPTLFLILDGARYGPRGIEYRMDGSDRPIHFAV